jgi:hypothetical protein
MAKRALRSAVALNQASEAFPVWGAERTGRDLESCLEHASRGRVVMTPDWNSGGYRGCARSPPFFYFK